MKEHKKGNGFSIVLKIITVIIFLALVIISFPVIDWFISDPYSTSPSIIYIFYTIMGKGKYYLPFQFGDDWFEKCYDLYSPENMLVGSITEVGFPLILFPLIFIIALADVLFRKKKKLKINLTLIFYSLILFWIAALFCYGIFFYVPQYDAFVDDISTSI